MSVARTFRIARSMDKACDLLEELEQIAATWTETLTGEQIAAMAKLKGALQEFPRAFPENGMLDRDGDIRVATVGELARCAESGCRCVACPCPCACHR